MEIFEWTGTGSLVRSASSGSVSGRVEVARVRRVGTSWRATCTGTGLSADFGTFLEASAWVFGALGIRSRDEVAPPPPELLAGSASVSGWLVGIDYRDCDSPDEGILYLMVDGLNGNPVPADVEDRRVVLTVETSPEPGL